MAMPEQKTVGKFVEYLLVRGVNSLLRFIPFGACAKIAGLMGLSLYFIAGRYRHLILSHLERAFPDKDESWRISIAKQNFRNMGRMLAEFAQTPHIDEKFMKSWAVLRPPGEEHAEIFRNGGIAILGHLGNWEWHGAVAGLISKRHIYTLVKRHTNFWSNRYLEESRNRAHMKLIYIDQNPFGIVKHLKRGEFVAFTSDQDARGNGEFFPFLGKLASTFLGPAAIARVTDVPVYFVWSHRDEKGRLVFEYELLKRPEIDPKNDIERWEREFTLSWVQKLEEKVRMYPADYLWAHNRWKTQPKQGGIR